MLIMTTIHDATKEFTVGGRVLTSGDLPTDGRTGEPRGSRSRIDAVPSAGRRAPAAAIPAAAPYSRYCRSHSTHKYQSHQLIELTLIEFHFG